MREKFEQIFRKFQCSDEFYSIKACNMPNTLATERALIQEDLSSKLLCYRAQFSVKTAGFGTTCFAQKIPSGNFAFYLDMGIVSLILDEFDS